jgi:putative beta-lysine N-acetyltransferase
MNDTITTFGDSILQHGKLNDRIYLMKLSKKDIPDIVEYLDELALAQGYSKIFAKVPVSAKDHFMKNGYLEEAHIPRFYDGIEDAYFMGKFFSSSRSIDNRINEINDVLNFVRSKKYDDIYFDLPEGYSFKICDKSHVSQMVEVYRMVFETYPFPIFESQYIMKTMDENIIYYSIWKNNKIVSLSSSEMDLYSSNVEMTDFATLPEFRGNGFAVYLLKKMEYEMKKKKMKISYTISRALSYGINLTFAKMNYEYSGTLLNNTNISGSFESMNVWYKFLHDT